jgi:YidC/Oxa1 family membrane protein insertase
MNKQSGLHFGVLSCIFNKVTAMPSLSNLSKAGETQLIADATKNGQLEALSDIIAMPFGMFASWLDGLGASLALALLLAALACSLAAFPLMLQARRSYLRLLKLQPQLADVQMRFAGHPDIIRNETRALALEGRIRPVWGMALLGLEFLAIVCLACAMLKPLATVFALDASAISTLTRRSAEIMGGSVQAMGPAAQFDVLECLRSDPSAFAGQFGISARLVDGLLAAQPLFLDANLTSVLWRDIAAPAVTGSQASVTVPAACLLAALLRSFVRDRANALKNRQRLVRRWRHEAAFIACTCGIAVFLPYAAGLFWACYNVFAVLSLLLCCRMVQTREHLDCALYAPHRSLGRAERELLGLQRPKLGPQLRDALPRRRPRRPQGGDARPRRRDGKRPGLADAGPSALGQKARQRRDIRRFYEPGLQKNLVIYSDSGACWRYFRRLVNYVIKNSEFTVHYVSSDAADKAFTLTHPRFATYYVGAGAIGEFMLRMDADIVVMTTPDLGAFTVQRSLVRADIEYVYLDHAMASFHLMLRKGALDEFDTVFVYGPNHVAELREGERLYQLPAKTLVKCANGLLEDLLESVEALGPRLDARRQILIAPTMSVSNILNLCLDEVLAQLAGKGSRIIIYPHPDFTRRYPERLRQIMERCHWCAECDILGGSVAFETGYISNKTIYQSDLVITDWSPIAQEFSYATKRPALFINTPMKAMNPEYALIPLAPLDISLRDEIGISLDIEHLGLLSDAVDHLIAHREEYREHIAAVMQSKLFDTGKGVHGGGDYLIARIKEIEYLRSFGASLEILAAPRTRYEGSRSLA